MLVEDDSDFNEIKTGLKLKLAILFCFKGVKVSEVFSFPFSPGNISSATQLNIQCGYMTSSHKEMAL